MHKFKKEIKRIGKDIEKAAKNIGTEVTKGAHKTMDAACDVVTFLPVATTVSNTHEYIKNGELRLLQDSLDNLNTEQLISSQTGAIEPPLQFAVSKVINEADALLTRTTPLNGEFNPHLKIIALLMIYDTCKMEDQHLLEAKFPQILQEAIEKKSDLRCHQTDIKDFINQLVSRYSRAGDDFKINFGGFKLGGDYFFTIEPGSQCDFTLSAALSPSCKIIFDDPSKEASSIDDACQVAVCSESTEAIPLSPDPEARQYMGGADEVD